MSDYVLKSELRVEVQRLIAEAQHPADPVSSEFPKMLYLHGDRNQTRTVFSEEEEAQAAEQGYQRTPGPQYEPGYPVAWIERPPDLGGTKTWDHRRVTLNSSAEMKLFEAVVDITDWVEDDYQHGGRGVSLDTLAEERREMLRQIVSREPLVPSDTPVEAQGEDSHE